MKLDYLCWNHYESISLNFYTLEMKTTVHSGMNQTIQTKHNSSRLKYQVSKVQVMNQTSGREIRTVVEV